MGRLHDVTGNVRAALNKLKGIKADLVRGQVGWQAWDFPKLIEALRQWREVNPVEVTGAKQRTKFLQTHGRAHVCLL